METILKRYYSKTQFPTVYGDGMILNPRTKLVIFNKDTWEDTASEEYSNLVDVALFKSTTIHPTIPHTKSAMETSDHSTPIKRTPIFNKYLLNVPQSGAAMTMIAISKSPTTQIFFRH